MGSWIIELDETGKRFWAEIRPGTKVIGLVAFAAVGTTLAVGLWALAAAETWAIVALLAVACASVFPVTLWIGLKQSFYRIRIDFEHLFVRIEEKRSFDLVRTYEAMLLDLVLLDCQGPRLLFTWVSDPEPIIQITTPSDAEANDLHSRLSILWPKPQ